MLVLCLRLVLAPLLVAAATLAHRRWGEAVGGRLVGLPLTAGPLLVLLTVVDGTAFTARVAAFDQAGDVAASAWCLAYALAARRWGPVRALAAATATFVVVATGVGRLDLSPVAATVAAALTLGATLRWWPAPAVEVAPGSPVEDDAPGGRSDLPLRMAAAAVFTFGLTEVAAHVGAGTSGLLGAIPMVTVILTVATHRRDGAPAATRLLHGVMGGSFAVVAFLAVVALALPRLGTWLTFVLAVGAALAAMQLRVRPAARRTAEPVPA